MSKSKTTESDVPSHYEGKIEPIVFLISVLTDGEFTGYLSGNIVKYISRFQRKGSPISDLEKAAKYLQWLTEHTKEVNKLNHTVRKGL